MNKSKVEGFFRWWLSIHPMNVRICENWLNLTKNKKEER